MRNIKFLLVTIFYLTAYVSVYAQGTWIEHTSGTTNALYSGTQNGGGFRTWVCGSAGTVKKATGNFNNWTNTSSGIPSTVTLYTISSYDTLLLTAGIIGTTTYLYRSSNGGTNWTQVFTQPNGFIDGAWMKNATTGILVGDPVGSRWSIFRTTNGGLTWDSTGRYLPQNNSEAGWNNSIWVKGDSVWFGTDNSRIYYSSNFGANWSAQPTAGVVNIYSIFHSPWFNNPAELLAGGANLIRTTNWGTTWTVVSGVPGTGNIVGIEESGPGVLNLLLNPYYIVRTDGKIYGSGFQGTWNFVYTPPSGNYTFIFKSRVLNTYGYILGLRDNGGISGCGCIFGSIVNLGGEIPNQFSLSQNYPNPFNPATKIRFSIPLTEGARGRNVILTIYDILGKEVEIIVNEKLSPGTYEVDFDGSNLSSGVYYYTLISGNFSQTKKMVLIK